MTRERSGHVPAEVQQVLDLNELAVKKLQARVFAFKMSRPEDALLGTDEDGIDLGLSKALETVNDHMGHLRGYTYKYPRNVVRILNYGLTYKVERHAQDAVFSASSELRSQLVKVFNILQMPTSSTEATPNLLHRYQMSVVSDQELAIENAYWDNIDQPERVVVLSNNRARYTGEVLLQPIIEASSELFDATLRSGRTEAWDAHALSEFRRNLEPLI